MAKSARDGLEYAIKFFVSQEAFQAESDLYGSGTACINPLSQFLPRVRVLDLLEGLFASRMDRNKHSGGYKIQFIVDHAMKGTWGLEYTFSGALFVTTRLIHILVFDTYMPRYNRLHPNRK